MPICSFMGGRLRPRPVQYMGFKRRRPRQAGRILEKVQRACKTSIESQKRKAERPTA